MCMCMSPESSLVAAHSSLFLSSHARTNGRYLRVRVKGEGDGDGEGEDEGEGYRVGRG